jgi:hypothetical protein
LESQLTRAYQNLRSLDTQVKELTASKQTLEEESKAREKKEALI